MGMGARWAIAGAAISLMLIGGCGKEISPQETRAGLVPGTDGLYRFCDGSTLIYFTDVSGSDDIVEAVWPGLCVKAGDGSWTYDSDAVTAAQKNGNPPDGQR